MANKKPGLDPLGLANPKKSKNKKGLKKPSGLDPVKKMNPPKSNNSTGLKKPKGIDPLKIANPPKSKNSTGLKKPKGFDPLGEARPKARPKKPAMPTPRPKAKKDFGMGQVDDFAKAKVKQGPPPPPAKKKKMGFFDRFKADFNKAVKETKRNFQGDAKKGTGRYKSVNERNLDSKGNYKGTNIKPTKLQESRMKKPKKNTMDFGAKKKKAAAPMYESKGTMGGVKKSKYYSGGGTVFTGR